MSLVIGNENCTTGLSKRIYDSKKARADANESFSALEASQKEEVYNVLKKDSFDIATAIVNEFTSNAVVNNIPSIIKTSLDSSPVVPQDGGAALKLNFSSFLGTNNGKGTIS